MLASKVGQIDSISPFGTQSTTEMASRADLEAITVVDCVPNGDIESKWPPLEASIKWHLYSIFFG